MKKVLVISLLLTLTNLFTINAATKVVCVGNSITAGYGLESSDSAVHYYTSVLQDSLGSSYAVTNYGISSQTMLKNTNASYWNTYAFTSSMSSLSNLVIIELGTNDAKYSYKDSFKIDYVAMIDTFSHLSSKPAIWICLQPPANNSSWGILDTTIKNQINPRIKDVALTKGVNLIDLYTELNKGRWNWFLNTDTVHLNVTGVIKMANYIYSLMKADTGKITQSGTTLTSSTAYAYQWYLNDTAISSATSKTLTISKKGLYKVSRRINSSDSSRLVDTITITSTPTITAYDAKKRAYGIASVDFVNSMLRVQMKGNVAPAFSVSVLDLKGAEIFSSNITGNSSTTAIIPMPIKGMRSGAYIYKISGGNIDVSGKFAVRH